jgi:hypothetical protein
LEAGIFLLLVLKSLRIDCGYGRVISGTATIIASDGERHETDFDYFTGCLSESEDMSIEDMSD